MQGSDEYLRKCTEVYIDEGTESMTLQDTICEGV